MLSKSIKIILIFRNTYVKNINNTHYNKKKKTENNFNYYNCYSNILNINFFLLLGIRISGVINYNNYLNGSESVMIYDLKIGNNYYLLLQILKFTHQVYAQNV